MGRILVYDFRHISHGSSLGRTRPNRRVDIPPLRWVLQMKLKIIDNVLNNALLISIQERINATEMPWNFVQNSAYSRPELIKQTPLNYSFSHFVLKPNFTSETTYHKEVVSPLNDMTYSISLILKDLFELDNTYSVFRLRWGMTTTIDKLHRNTPHTDLDLYNGDVHIPHKVILFYLNDSDGDTYFYDKEHKIIDSVTPKGNRAVLFDGSILHSSSKPIEFTRRIVLNINLIDKKGQQNGNII